MSDDHIKNIRPGERIEDLFVIRRIEMRDYEGRKYLVFLLGCSRGKIRGVYWGEDAEDLSRQFAENDVIKIRGIATDYRGERNIKIEAFRRATDDEIDIKKLLPAGRYPPEKLVKSLYRRIDSVEDEYLRALLEAVFTDDFVEEFSVYPAAKLWHGAYLTGLAEHTLRVAKICDIACDFYPDCRKDLLITGALLHDVGKVDEIKIGGFFDYSVTGRLVGHIVLGAIRVAKAIEGIPGFPQNLAAEVLHLIVSHHGKQEFGSPVEPKTIEAMILHHADMLDGQAEGVQHIVQRELPAGREFSDYVKILGRYIYLDGYRSDEDFVDE